MTAIAAVAMIGLGAFAVPMRLPSVSDQPIPLADQSTPLAKGAAEATPESGQGNLTNQDAEATPVEANVVAAAEVPTAPNRTADGPAADRSPTVVAGIPANYLTLYRDAAATCPGLHWSTLAAIGKKESNHGRSTLPGVRSGANPSGAKGPMQFLQSTFNAVTARHPVPPGGAIPPSAHNPHDAVYTAAAYLCDNGARDNRNLRGAIYAYNHSRAYVNTVLDAARDYRQAAQRASARPSSPGASAPPRSSPAAVAPRVASHRGSAAVTFARAQLGKPYVWGGNGEPGFDCSGLTTAAYAAAETALPRTAQTQYNHGPRLPTGSPLQPGDLLFFGTPRNIHHVGISLGGTLMIHSPTFGQTVRIQDYRNLRDYAGASRPA
ncbi:MAG: NlpC/P60 family protein [Pseudonocardiaceae bacterium]